MQYVDLAVAEIRRLADTCRGADPATPVPSCPGWDLAELQRHVGGVHRWAATMVERSSQERLRRDELELGIPEDPTRLPDWIAAGADFVEPRFRAADPATPMWAWGWPKNAGFWPRRMVHETAIHRADAELALGRAPSVAPDVAVDGVGELLDNLPEAAYFAPGVAELKGDGELLRLHSPESTWLISLQPDGYSWVQDTDDPGADATLSTLTASDLLLTLYGRRPLHDSEVTGNRALLEHWLSHSTL
jgi:uncharacterized protein (TIGR03083 family)